MPLPARACAALTLALALGACSGSGSGSFLGLGSSDVACPRMAIIPELQAVAKFGPGPGREDSDVLYGARLLKVDPTCSGDKKDKGVTVLAKLGVMAVRIKPDVSTGQVTYFEAVIDRKQQILAERDFTIDLKWPGTQRDLTITDELTTFVPFAKDAGGDDYAILVGFRLTAEELQYNREHLPKQ